MTSLSTERVSKLLVFLGIVVLHLIVLGLLGRMVLFREAASAGEDGVPNMQIVKIAPVPPRAPPLPQPSQAPPEGGGPPSLFLPVVITPPTPANFSLIKVPSTPEMLARVPNPGFGHGQGTGTGEGNGVGGGEGKDEFPASADPSPARPTSTTHPRKTGSMLIFDYFLPEKIAEAKQWLDEGNDPNVAKPMQQHTAESHLVRPLDLAVRNNYREMVELLLDHGANPDPDPLEKDYPGIIYFAVEYQASPEIIKLLLDHGARPDLRMPSDPAYAQTPEWPHPWGYNSAQEAVAARMTLDGRSPPGRADQVAVLKLLMEHGADPLRLDNRGKCALSMAQDLHRPDLVYAIEDYLSHAPPKN